MAVHTQKRPMLWINILGGVAVLGCYAQGLLSHPANSGELWGDVPQAIRSVYTVWMFVAAASYLIFTYYLLFHVDPKVARVARRFEFQIFNLLYLVILLSSALWMPLTFQMLAAPSDGVWLGIRLVLWAAGLASLAFVAALLSLRPRQPRGAYWLAVIGSFAFTIQTGLLDAVIWVYHFPA